MVPTSLAAVVVGLMAVGTTPAWQTDYRTALAQVSVEHKPVAVFIAPGSSGTKVVSEGTLGTDAAELLSQKYVALHVDSTTPAGREVAKSFGMTEGLVISDRTGGVQAYRHAGPISQAELASTLRVYGQETVVVSTTVAADAQPVTTSTSLYTPSAPAAVAQPVYAAPAPVYQSAPVFQPARSSCPNGKCPYAR